MKSKNNNKMEFKNNNYQIYNDDCVNQLSKMENNVFDFSIFSPPFAELYVYSDDPRDMGNVLNYDEFFNHFSFLTPELYRTLKPGRLIAVHCMDVSLQKGKDGVIGLKDFSGDLIRNFTDQGFIYHTRVTIWKNPVTEMQRTKALGLLHKTIKKDSSMSRVGGADYILVFRKPGENKVPITHQDTDQNKENYLPVDLWQKYASPVWNDINYSNTLQYRSARADKDEKHICPLQIETIERCLHLWSNEGDNVLSPFSGIGSEGHTALKMNRKFTGIELKPSYFQQMHRNLERLLESKHQLEIF
ncbi:site-specific DNA-methyltransferase [uncultured Polaribacter sp.]|uniref:DNA-methyltransferase n=1 Tax=uncultured Polaribacter sp. TaxID=174711 RepID=UPI00259BDE68|nr:site-specific DNA-methyltransferase [uncultured Polaribacter sp.]